MTAYQLAEKVERFLDLKKKAGSSKAYGPHKANAEDEHKKAEQELRKTLESILRPQQEQPTMFANEKTTAH